MALITEYPTVEALKAAIPGYIVQQSGLVVLDVGPGIRPQQLARAYLLLMIEPHQEYIDLMRRYVQDSDRHLYLCGTALNLMPALVEKSVDTIVAGDVIEHMTREHGQLFLAEAERLARRQIILFTPWGYFPQHHTEGDKDRWGLHGGYWQSHRSGWVPEDFDDSWTVLACRHYHFEDEHGDPLEEGFGAFWAIKNMEVR